MIALIQSGFNIKKIITHKFHFTDFEKAFAIMQEGNCGKIILEWS
jgi:threonine 3-dehydrogenase